MTRAIIFSLALFGLTACETAKGAGRDLEKAGNTITKAVQDIQKSF